MKQTPAQMLTELMVMHGIPIPPGGIFDLREVLTAEKKRREKRTVSNESPSTHT